MAIGGKGGSKMKKINKKKAADPFTKKEWYEIKAPAMFAKRTCARTLITRTQGTKIASEGLKKRVVRLSLGDLDKPESETYRKFALQIENVQGRNCYTNFHGMQITRDKLCSLVKKKQSTIQVRADVKTTDGYKLRIFVIAFTGKPKDRVGHFYAKSSSVKKIRARMIKKINAEVSVCTLRKVVEQLIPDSIGGDCCKVGSALVPLSTAIVRKVKVLKRPKLDLGKLMDMHGDKAGEGESVDRDHYEPPIVTST
ncbi:40S ribosomal protein S3-1 [Cichlidogyrus casuarinus]|uniref:Small ribosomal subunit protein eS1 n=1 Tax=Cichlidogyrus casuarinus TaxID=1844966 RepID=A0ABD2QFB5_9PLAT